ncbi:MAG: pyridoxal-phosphate-dependent aminotransferase family protein [Bacilli bacterium]
MINFTVGPVQSSELVNNIGSEQVPYFRTEEFSNLMLENERLMKKFVKSEEDARVVFITGSGTASMEATVINTLNENDRALIVNGGSFGARFVELCRIHNIPYDDIKLDLGCPLTKEILSNYDGKKYTAFLVNLDETSTGVLYDLDIISEFCQKNNIFLIVDAISAFLADEINMADKKIDVLITGSQKALACPPGISIIVLSNNALDRVSRIDSKSMYFDLKSALKNGERGQTPFTPAVGILRQINARLNDIDQNGGVDKEVEKTHELALYFREKIKNLPLKMVTVSPTNAVTSLYSLNNRAYDTFLYLKDNCNIWICPNGGDLKDKVFRVGHIGCLTKKHYDYLIEKLNELNNKGLL